MDMIGKAVDELMEAHIAETQPRDKYLGTAKTLGALPVIIEWVLWYAHNDGVITEEQAKEIEGRLVKNITDSAARVMARTKK